MNILFLILLQYILNVNTQITPAARNVHTANLKNGKLYISGGNLYDTNGKISPQDFNLDEVFFYLDLTESFNTTNLPWVSESNLGNNLLFYNGATSVIGGINNDTIVLFDTDGIVYTYNTNNSMWDKPKISGNSPAGRRNIDSVVDNNEKMYLFGGYQGDPNTFFNEFDILDTQNMAWETGILTNAPDSRASYSATLLSNGKIIYLGGISRNSTPNGDPVFQPFNPIYIYDTINNGWQVQNTTGDMPNPRWGFSGVLGLDMKRIIVYGGIDDGAPTGGLRTSAIHVLDVISFEWYIPMVSGPLSTTRFEHTATVVGKYMVVAFGMVNTSPYNPPKYRSNNESDVLLLDISDDSEYKWTTSYITDSPSTVKSNEPNVSSNNNNTSNNNNNPGPLIGAIIGSSIGSALLSLGGYLLYKKYRNRNESNNSVLRIDKDRHTFGN